MVIATLSGGASWVSDAGTVLLILVVGVLALVALFAWLKSLSESCPGEVRPETAARGMCVSAPRSGPSHVRLIARDQVRDGWENFGAQRSWK